MKKSLLVLYLSLLCVAFLALVVSAESITVTDDGATQITLGECVIDGLDKELPTASSGFTFVLDTEANTAKITKWANYATADTLVIPSTVTYNEVVYTVTAFDRIVYNSDNGNGNTNHGNFCLLNVYIPDTVTAIPNSAFAACRAIECFFAGSGIVSIGNEAFTEAGFTAGRYYVDNGNGTNVVAETVGINAGEIKEFVIFSKNLETIGSKAFYNMEFALGTKAIIYFDSITKIGSEAFATNLYQEQSGHYLNGHGIVLEKIDIRGFTTDILPLNAFDRTYGVNHVILNADQMNYFDSFKSYRKVPMLFEIYGGEAPESAKALSHFLFTENLQHYGGANINMQFVFHGYVNAYADQADGATNSKWNTNYAYLNYYFENKDEFNHYISSVKSSANGETTLSRYADYEKGYFTICNGDGTASEYNCKYTDGLLTLVQYTPSDDEKSKVALSKSIYIEGENCTPSVFCVVCGYRFESGIPHSISSSIVYASGYFQAGTKVEVCTNDGCNHKNELALDPLFVCLGYSVYEAYDGSVTQCFKVNKEALGAYMEQSPDFRLGVVASTIGTPLDKNGNALDAKKVIKCDITNACGTVFEIKVMGLKSFPDAAFVACGYVVDKDGLYYLDGGKTVETPTFKSYNQLFGAKE